MVRSGIFHSFTLFKKPRSKSFSIISLPNFSFRLSSFTALLVFTYSSTLRLSLSINFQSFSPRRMYSSSLQSKTEGIRSKRSFQGSWAK